MKICFTLDDVLRAKTEQIGKIYKKYINPDIELEKLDFSTNDYCSIFNFESKNEFKKFLYEDYPFEIFGEAKAVNKMLDKKFNLWLLSLNNDEDISEFFDVMISNPMEFNTSIGFTCFFLSQIATRVREFYFPLDSTTLWEKCDVVVTADPKYFEGKPNGKIVVKIETSYNKEYDADFTYDSLDSLLDDTEFCKKLIEYKNNFIK